IDQPPGDLPAAPVLQVYRQARLVAMDHRERKADLGAAVAPLAHRVPFGALDLDNLGAEVGQDRGRVRAGQSRGQLDDAYPAQEGRLAGLVRVGAWGHEFSPLLVLRSS